MSSELEVAIARAHGARKDALLAARAALGAADPRLLVGRALKLERSAIVAGVHRMDLDATRRILVVGGGKASGLMAVEVERILGDRIDVGAVIVPEAQRSLPRLKKVKFLPSTHPLPTEKGALAVKEMLGVLSQSRSRDLVICLISGGGSSLMPLPVEGVSMQDLAGTTKLLLNAGAEIGEINCVRKHLSQIMGGRLIERIGRAEVLSLIISDVVGDDLGSVASGPTVPDPTTFARAKEVLRRRRVWVAAPSAVRRMIQAGVDRRVSETPKPGSPLFAKVHNVLVGSNMVACAAAKAFLDGTGYRVPFVRGSITGEARKVGRRLALLARSEQGAEPWAAVWGGETTVTVKGQGVGGRNQEVALAAAIGLRGSSKATILSFGTDGIDGVTDAAGAIADSATFERAKRRGLDPGVSLENNDSHLFFKALGDLMVTGPTGTNVNDVMIALKGKD